MIRRAACVVGVLFVIVSTVSALPLFPGYFTVPPAVRVVDPNRDIDESYGESLMPIGDNDNVKRGRHIFTRLAFDGVEYAADDSWSRRFGIRFARR